jgi:hypothetical protein
MRPLLFLHLLLVTVVGGWWFVYFWNHTPARDVYTIASAAHRARAELELFSLEPAFAAARVAVGDITCGFLNLLVLSYGTRVYVRRAQIWLDARGSGDAVSFGTTDLASQALSANKKV